MNPLFNIRWCYDVSLFNFHKVPLNQLIVRTTLPVQCKRHNSIFSIFNINSYTCHISLYPRVSINISKHSRLFMLKSSSTNDLYMVTDNNVYTYKIYSVFFYENFLPCYLLLHFIKNQWIINLILNINFGEKCMVTFLLLKSLFCWRF